VSKIKYIYNPKTLQYEPAKLTLNERLKRLGWTLATGLAFSGVVITVAWQFFRSPQQIKDSREVEALKLNYEVMAKRMELAEKVLEDLTRRDNDVYRAVFEAEPIPDEIRDGGIGGTDRFEKFKGYDNEKLMRETAERLDRLSRRLVVQSKSYDQLFELARRKEELLRSMPAIMPIKVNDPDQIASGFGYRVHPVFKTERFHAGVDFTAPVGTPIYATGNGVVERADRESGGYGNCVQIRHGFGFLTLYAHMSKMLVVPGQKVKRGQVIGLLGNTGLSTGPHCHYEVHRNGEPVNPLAYFIANLSPEEYTKITRSAMNPSQSFD
jgi:murein DD-endopeptidase MepM/ murein hydrolase activator NlpD